MALHLHATPPPGGRPMTQGRLYEACYRGDVPAEALDQKAREHLVHDLWLKGWTDVEIAQHTRMTTYTTVRIRTRLGLAAQQRQEEAVA